ncbi:S-adenosyl-L-methionine:benzoic acid/salicylic acid carboxyl methyltransferase 3-like [Humulus lupulus]|uniref:S-adenosyl-L-methionine:benzoic acid/salicylic acid carboxyl methyltransferase 3-like n=1 Tax=Humulus lupulus TaxID=3486 RepID=UPI002B40F058|nr:S-adenosyl-L-methionine:benzoic acid/salicylic acid carboxyl methyltransferase 3-like [Humulus lupulus]
MEVVQVLHMNGGVGEKSYANNSLVQKKVISMTKPITEEAIINHCSTKLSTTVAIADLGCSSGPNTFFVVSELVKVVHKLCKKLGCESPEFQLYLNDLPGNDFNSIFRTLPSFQHSLTTQMGTGFGPCFVTGVPGSFYGRLFPTKSLHFVHSSYSLQWLSQVPEGLENYNKGNIYMASTSPPSVIKAYKDQFQRDFSLFLKCRSKELVAGGSMVLTILGRKSEDPTSKDGCYIWELLAMALNHMVSEGLIEEEKVDSFNIPQYTPSPSELTDEVVKEGSFTVNKVEVSQVHWSASDDTAFGTSEELNDGGYSVAKCMRAVAEPLLVSHFGEAIIDEVFRRYREIIVDRMSKEKTEFFNVIISLNKGD